jgi:hypothetical protein
MRKQERLQENFFTKIEGDHLERAGGWHTERLMDGCVWLRFHGATSLNYLSPMTQTTSEQSSTRFLKAHPQGCSEGC